MSTRNPGGPFTSPPKYALAVSIIFTKATEQAIVLGTEPKHVLSTSILYHSLANNGRFDRIPMSEAAPGDIIIASHRNQADGYAGIAVDHGRIVSNSSHGVQDNSNLAEIQRSRQEMAIFRYIGVQGRRSYSLANAGYNDDEPRLPAGQPGGGQWTGSGGGTKARQSVHNARRKSGRCAGGSEETEPESREDLEREERLENFRELTPEEQAYRNNEAKAEEMIKQVIEKAKAEAAGRKPVQKPQSILDAIRRIFGGETQQQKPTDESDASQDKKEPPQLARGKRAHTQEPVLPGEQSEVTTPSGKRMDRYNEEQAHIREIKPDNPRAIKQGQKQAEGYKDGMEAKTGRPHTTEVTPYNPRKY